jgi:hypothetical protein
VEVDAVNAPEDPDLPDDEGAENSADDPGVEARMRTSRDQMRQLNLIAVVVICLLTSALFAVEWLGLIDNPGFPKGFFWGGMIALLNLHILARGFFRFVHTGQGGLGLLAGVGGSLLFMLAACVAVVFRFPQSALGFALGLASPALFGPVFGILVFGIPEEEGGKNDRKNAAGDEK